MPIAIFAIAGGIIGGTIAASIFGITAFAIGWAIGSLVGQLLAPRPSQTITGPRLENTKPAVSSIIGSPIQIPFGLIRVPGGIIWSNKITERRVVTKHKSKGGSGKSKTTKQITFEYYLDFAVAICEGPILGVKKIWANNKIIYDQDGAVKAEPWLKYTLYEGSETQTPDPLMERIIGRGKVPAYRGLAYIVFQQFKLEEYGNRAPYIIDFEIATTTGYQKLPAIDFLHQATSGQALHNDQIRYIGPTGNIVTGLTGDNEHWGAWIRSNAVQAPRLLRIPDTIKRMANRIPNSQGLGKSTFLGLNSRGLFVAIFPVIVSGPVSDHKAIIGWFNSGFSLVSTYGPVSFADGKIARVVFNEYFIKDNINTFGISPSITFYYINIFGDVYASGGGTTKSIRFRRSLSLESAFGNTIGHVADFDFSSSKANSSKNWQGLGPNVVIDSYRARHLYATLVTTNDAKRFNTTWPGNTDVMIYRYSKADMIGSWTGDLTYFRINPWIRLNNDNLAVSNPIITGTPEFTNNRAIISIYILNGDIYVFATININAWSKGIVCYKILKGTIPHADGYYQPTEAYVCPYYFGNSEVAVLANGSSSLESGVQYGKGYMDFSKREWTAVLQSLIVKFNTSNNTWQVLDKEYNFGMSGGYEVPLQKNNYLWVGVNSQPRAEIQFITEKIIEDQNDPPSIEAIVSNICDRAGLSNNEYEFVTCCVQSGGYIPS